MNPAKKTIVFDFGNVLIDLDFEMCFRKFENILNVDWSERKLPQFLKDAIYQYDIGQLDNDNFIATFQKLNEAAKSEDLIEAWNSLIREMPNERFNFLTDMASEFNLVLLSNINDLHLSFIHKYLKDKHDILDFENGYFDRVFYSHLIGKRKPDNNIYEHVSSELGIDSKDILFIDDLKQNVQAAKDYGWNAVRHKETDEIITMMPVYLRMVNFK